MAKVESYTGSISPRAGIVEKAESVDDRLYVQRFCRASEKNGAPEAMHPRLCLAPGQERFEGLVTKVLPVLDLLITDECHHMSHEVLLFCEAPTLAEVQKDAGRCLRGFRRDYSVLASHRASPSSSSKVPSAAID